jgi:hypothetical protein
MKTVQIVLIIVGVLCGSAAMGCWLVLQLGGVSYEGPITAAVMYGFVVFFTVALTTSAFLRDRAKGLGSIASRSMYLVGVCGIPFLLFIAVISLGGVFRMGGYDCLLILFASFIFFGRERAKA